MTDEPCAKRWYASVAAARRCRRYRFRLRVYLCKRCSRYHVTNNEKK